jgi:hypothetical protein
MTKRLNRLRFDVNKDKPELDRLLADNRDVAAQRKLEAAELRQILARNFKLLSDLYSADTSQVALGRFYGIGAGTVGRINRCEAGVSIDTLQAIASAVDREAWMLLVPMTSAEAMPELVTTEIRERLEEASRVAEAVENIRTYKVAKKRLG